MSLVLNKKLCQIRWSSWCQIQRCQRPWLFFPRFQFLCETDNSQIKNSYPYSNEFSVQCKQSLLSITHLAKNQNFLHILIYCDFTVVISGSQNKINQICITVGCVPSACCPYLKACTARGGLPPGGGVGLGVSAPGGYLLNVGVCSRGCLLLEGMSAPGGISAPGRSVCSGEAYSSMHWGRHQPYEQNNWQTGVKTLPSQTLFAGGKYLVVCNFSKIPSLSSLLGNRLKQTSTETMAENSFLFFQ